MSVVVVTDSAASLPSHAVEERGVVVVPLTLVLGGIIYTDGVLDPTELVQRSITQTVSTSSPSPGDFVKEIENQGPDRGVLVVTVSSKMSATFEAAVVASRYFDPGSVRVVDSGTAAGAQGLVVLAAATLAAAGAPLDQVAALAEQVSSEVRLMAALDNLDHLARSGRVPGVAAWAGRSLGVRAVFEFGRGHVRPRRPALGMKAFRDRVVEAMIERPVCPGVLRAAVLHAQAQEMADDLEADVQAAVPGSETFVAPFSSVMVAHTGPGLIGAAWWWDNAVRL
ncbi:MAG: DegV family protein [Acidimicrobiales bacterium]